MTHHGVHANTFPLKGMLVKFNKTKQNCIAIYFTNYSKDVGDGSEPPLNIIVSFLTCF